MVLWIGFGRTSVLFMGVSVSLIGFESWAQVPTGQNNLGFGQRPAPIVTAKPLSYAKMQSEAEAALTSKLEAAFPERQFRQASAKTSLPARVQFRFHDWETNPDGSKAWKLRSRKSTEWQHQYCAAQIERKLATIASSRFKQHGIFGFHFEVFDNMSGAFDSKSHNIDPSIDASKAGNSKKPEFVKITMVIDSAEKPARCAWDEQGFAKLLQAADDAKDRKELGAFGGSPQSNTVNSADLLKKMDDLRAQAEKERAAEKAAAEKAAAEKAEASKADAEGAPAGEKQSPPPGRSESAPAAMNGG